MDTSKLTESQLAAIRELGRPRKYPLPPPSHLLSPETGRPVRPSTVTAAVIILYLDVVIGLPLYLLYIHTAWSWLPAELVERLDLIGVAAGVIQAGLTYGVQRGHGWARIVVLVLSAVVLLVSAGAVLRGDPLSIPGVAVLATVIVLLNTGSARSYFRSWRWFR